MNPEQHGYSDNIDAIKTQLERLNLRLPGHLQTMAKEFLARVDSMTENIRLDTVDLTQRPPGQ